MGRKMRRMNGYRIVASREPGPADRELVTIGSCLLPVRYS
jgi:hypothetical protein